MVFAFRPDSWIASVVPRQYTQQTSVPPPNQLHDGLLSFLQECPTWWRMYAYLSDAAHVEVIAYRNEKCGCKLGEGGEGYIADDEWCYNCGNAGHLGDVSFIQCCYSECLKLTGLPRTVRMRTDTANIKRQARSASTTPRLAHSMILRRRTTGRKRRAGPDRGRASRISKRCLMPLVEEERTRRSQDSVK